MDKAAYLEALRGDSSRFADIARRGLAADVPCCPGWSVGDLVLHLGGVYEWVVAVLASTALDRSHIEAVYDEVLAKRKQRAESGMAGSMESVSWFEQLAGHVREELESRQPSDPTWTWWDPDQTAGFWQRRMAQETAVHLWDIQSAFGCEQPIERELAADGIDEALFIHLAGEYVEAPPDGRGERYHFHCTDGAGEWLVSFNSEGISVTREHAKGDLAFIGTASDLLLFIWRRIPAEKITVFGDPAQLDRYLDLLRVDS